MLFTTAGLLASFAASAAAAKAGRTFAVNHFYGNGPLTVGRMDPIISPGGPSGHHHTIQGGSNFALTMSDTTLLDSRCTSSLVKNDNSNYWTPSVFFQDPNDGTFTPVPMFYMNVYYFFEATDDTITAFQPGHRMVVGSPELRTPPVTGGESILDLAQGTPQPVQFTCPRQNTNAPLYPVNSDGLHGSGIQDPNNAGAGVGFPDQNCDGYASPLRADIHFPSCYNPEAGIDAFRTNMQFPSSAGASAGGRANCPPGWIHTPHLFYEVYWNTPLFADRWTPGQGKQPFVLSNGDPTGYSLHADFISGWDVDTLQQDIDNCNAGDDGMDKCPGLMGGLNDPSTSCNIPAAVPDNFVIDNSMSVKLTALPGNNPIVGFGGTVAPAAPAAGSNPPPSSAAAPAPAKSSAAAANSSPSGAGAGAGSDHAAGQTHTTTKPPVSPHETPSPASHPASTKPPSKPPTHTPIPSASSSHASGSKDSNGVAPPTGWSYYGCYSDTIQGTRVLSGITFANIGNHEVTDSKCITYCAAAGYSMAGTEYGGQCFCGNELVGSSKIDETHCSMPCEGDGTETCGGSVALTVYKSSKVKSRRSNRHLAAHAKKHVSPQAFKA